MPAVKAKSEVHQMFVENVTQRLDSAIQSLVWNTYNALDNDRILRDVARLKPTFGRCTTNDSTPVVTETTVHQVDKKKDSSDKIFNIEYFTVESIRNIGKRLERVQSPIMCEKIIFTLAEDREGYVFRSREGIPTAKLNDWIAYARVDWNFRSNATDANVMRALDVRDQFTLDQAIARTVEDNVKKAGLMPTLAFLRHPRKGHGLKL